MAPATRSRAAAGGARAVMAITFRAIALCRRALTAIDLKLGTRPETILVEETTGKEYVQDT